MKPLSEEHSFELVAPEQSNALEAMERAQIDVQISTAKRFPRSMQTFHKRAESMVCLDEETAASCIYRRPVGKKMVDGKMVEEFAEGESIRMAEIVAATYGNIRVSAKIVEQTDRYVTCVGMAHDLESNYASQSEARESTVKRDGTPFSENMRTVVAKACLSKAWRDALFRVVPKSLCKTIYDKAVKVAIGDSTTLDKRRAKVSDWVNKCGVAPSRVWTRLGVNGPADLTLEHIETLTGLHTAIKDGDITIDDAFPAEKPAVTSPQILTPSVLTTPAAQCPSQAPTVSQVVSAKPTPTEAPSAPVSSFPQESAKPRTAENQTPTPEPQKVDPSSLPDLDKPLEAIKEFMKRDSVTMDQIVAWARHSKLMKSEQGSIDQLSTSRLKNIAGHWSTALAEIRAMPAQ